MARVSHVVFDILDVLSFRCTVDAQRSVRRCDRQVGRHPPVVLQGYASQEEDFQIKGGHLLDAADDNDGGDNGDSGDGGDDGGDDDGNSDSDGFWWCQSASLYKTWSIADSMTSALSWSHTLFPIMKLPNQNFRRWKQRQ